MLCDSEIRARLSEFDFHSENEQRPFDADKQIKVASVDLRLSNHYWKPKTSVTALKFLPSAFGSDTVDLFVKSEVNEDDSISIKPHSFLLCRTYEKFRIPPDLSARLHSRSSYARLGIQVSTTSDFINPGWSGYMPLVIYNSSPFSVKLRPFDAIAQLCFVPLTGKPTKNYNDQDRVAKYVEDDGGPSNLWVEICEKGLQETNFKNRDAEIDRILEFAKKLNEPTRKFFLSSLPKLSKSETSSQVISKFVNTHKDQEIALRAFAIIGGPLLIYPIGWILGEILELGNISGLLTVLSAMLSVLLFIIVSNHIAKFDGRSDIEGYWKDVG